MSLFRSSSCRLWLARSLLLIWAFFFCFSFADEFGVFPKVDEKADQAIEVIFCRPSIAPSHGLHAAKVFPAFREIVAQAVLPPTVVERFSISAVSLQKYHPPPGGSASFRMTAHYLI